MSPDSSRSYRLNRRHFLVGSAGSLFGLSLEPLVVSEVCAAEAASRPEPLYWAWWGWEPLAHYRRSGGVVGAVNTQAPWLADWHAHLHTEDTVRTMADLGINLGCTHFFKGFGLIHERAEQQNTARLVKRAHQNGIKILGYCQSRSLYYEQFLDEEPKAEDWIQRDEEGNLQFWSSSKYRWAPCILSQEFRAYMKRAIQVGIEEIGLDGFHFDNDYCLPCYCSRCEKTFAAWMTERHPEIPDPKLPPREKESPARINEPLVQEWVRWRCETLAEYHADLEKYARSLKSDILLLGNPAYPRNLNSSYVRSVWAPWIGRHLDLMFAENGNFPRIENGIMVSQVRACKDASAVGYRVISTVWKKDKKSPGYGLPETEQEVGLQVAESAAQGAIPGANWALRPLEEGDKMRVDRPDLKAALGKYIHFARRQDALLKNAQPVRDIAVLHSFASVVFDNTESLSLSLGIEEVLIRGGFPWEVVFSDNLERLIGFGTLIVAGQTHLNNAECHAIREFVRGGGSLILVGENGINDENGRKRSQNPFTSLEGDRVFRLNAEEVRVSVVDSHEISVPLPENWRSVAETIRKVSDHGFSARLRGSDTVTLSAWRIGNGGLLIQLVNYAKTPTPKEMRVELSQDWQGKTKLRFSTPDASEQSLPMQTPLREVAIPSFAIHGVLVIE